jgi:hypothetical protein
MSYISRKLSDEISKSLKNFPVVAITGPRQCGKSTLARHLLKTDRELLYLDLERPSDLQKLNDPEWFFQSQKDKIICLDEIQRKADLFPVIRSLSDEWGKSGSFLILGSASHDLLKQSSESLAGRISYKRLFPFLWEEICGSTTLENYLVRGGFPGSFLAEDDDTALEWKINFISTFIERDLMQWTGSSPVSVKRLWQMLAHLNGQVVNYSMLASSLGVSNTTARNYSDILASVYMLDIVPPHLANDGKRLIKSPKIYINDTGLLSGLLGLGSFEQIAGHPVFGTLWESTVLANLRGSVPSADIRFYRTSHNAEVDFIVILPSGTVAIECKASRSPDLTRGTYTAIDDIKPLHTFIVSPVDRGFPFRKGIDVVSLTELPVRVRELAG